MRALERDHKKVIHNEIQNEFQKYQKDEKRKFEIQRQRAKDLSENYMGVVHAQMKQQEREGHNIRKELHHANTMKKHYDAQVKLNKMRKQRIRAVMDFHHIQAQLLFDK